MPCVEGKIGGIELTPELVEKLETGITGVLREHIAPAFANGLNFAEGSREFKAALAVAQEIMPGWTWVSITPQVWAVRGRRVGDEAIVARFHILVLAGALPQTVRQEVAHAVAEIVESILGESNKPVQLFVDIFEGEVDMSLPADLFGDLLKGASLRLLKVDEVMKFFMSAVLRKLK
jgi:hypothetical protein